jgi:prolyl oligopeptidase
LKTKLILLSLLSLFLLNACQSRKSKDDPEDLYLESAYGSDALKWVKLQNAASEKRLENDSRYLTLKKQFLKINNDPHKILEVNFHGIWAYNLWKDEKNIHGLWRRMTIQNYIHGKRNWQNLLDIDELSKRENKNWVFEGSSIFKNHAILMLSNGGKDAQAFREYDLIKKEFISNGFNLAEGKHDLTWVNENEIVLARATLPEDLTNSGYPKDIRIWKRGESAADAKLIFSGKKEDTYVDSFASRPNDDQPARYKIIRRGIDYFNFERFLLQDDGQLVKLNIPTQVNFDVQDDQMIMLLKTDWLFKDRTYLTGSLIQINLKDFLNGTGTVNIVFTPTKTQFLQSKIFHNGRYLLILTENVNDSAVEVLPLGPKWIYRTVKLPKNSTISIGAYSNKLGLANIHSEGFINPETIFNLDLSNGKLVKIEQAPNYFDSRLFQIDQFFAISKDETRVPYYVVHKKNMLLDGKTPTIISAYGGFETSKKPYYLDHMGAAWLSKGGAFVSANIRGGGEYGPSWHSTAIKENRQKVYDDFFAISNDVIARKITSAEHLGAVGASNGGLLMGVAMTQQPQLYKALCIEVPLFDMVRYTKIGAGASWVGEYGDPDNPKMKKIIEAYSPYQNIKPEVDYPEVFFMTSTADDRVHPSHARRAAAKMERQKHGYYYYENTEGGHNGTANLDESAKWSALKYTYFMQKLM